MHPEVLDWVGLWATTEPISVLDIGGRDLNGSTRPLFPNADYTALDLRPGPGVDVVADATTWVPDRVWDLVLCTEVFEHTPDWPQVCKTAFAACRPGGRFVVTCAGPGRAPHSGIAATGLTPGEYYANLSTQELHAGLAAAGWSEVRVERLRLDLRGTAVKQ